MADAAYGYLKLSEAVIPDGFGTQSAGSVSILPYYMRPGGRIKCQKEFAFHQSCSYRYSLP